MGTSDTPDLTVMLVVSIAFFAALLIAAGAILYGTIAKNRWGINLRPVSCPSCGTRMPRVRVPKSTGEALWGGATCPTCGCRMDKWGRAITERGADQSRSGR
jgi:hypothetical protein